MTRSQELFELLSARRARTREAEKSPAPAAAKPRKKAATTAVSRSVEAVRPSPSSLVAPESQAPARIAARGAVVVSRRGAVLLGVLWALLVAIAFFAGERVGRSGGIGATPISAIAPGSSAPSDDVLASTAKAGTLVEAGRSRAENDVKTYGIRVVTYEFNQANAERASEVQEYLKSLGIRDVEARQGKNGTEIRIYAGRYSSEKDPALTSMLEKLKLLPGDRKSKKGSKPFGSAYIMARGD